ncbi:MAG: hypothetical protein QOF49_1846 [Chloroflexota bacterium]|jgi:hypothetical protein|nr:hypothetical protein [Chloroflexota bacterium]
MPNRSDVTPTSHDRHDQVLVAALAAGDLAANDRDRAIALTDTCADCATLRDDLVSIARATAAVPPPITASGRDFRLTPADAARLRPSGWRRLAAALAAPRLAFARPLGVALTTLGLIGLLIGNVSLGMGSSAAQPATPAAGAPARAAASAAAAALPAGSAAPGEGLNPIAAPGSNAPPATDVPQDVATTSTDGLAASGGADVQGGPFGASETAGTKAAPTDTTEELAAGDASAAAVADDPVRLRNVVFIAAVAIGLALLVVSRLRSGRQA